MTKSGSIKIAGVVYDVQKEMEGLNDNVALVMAIS